MVKVSIIGSGIVGEIVGRGLMMLEKYSWINAGEFGVCMNPEFLTEIESSWS